jgi:cholesterol transport system auxiliary component
MKRDLLKGLLLIVAGALLLGACAVGGSNSAPPAAFDLGSVNMAGSSSNLKPLPVLQLTEISAPPWLATTGIAYRLAYQSEFQAQYYRDSRWLAPPAVMLTERLRQKAALSPRSASAKPIALRVELVEFEQRFVSPTQSEVRLSLRASLGDGPTLTKAFELVKPSPSPDAVGAVQAFSEASDEILTQVAAWTALNSKP